MRTIYLTKEQAQSLLGRSLTTTESASFDVWEEIAEQRLANLLCVQCIEELYAQMAWETTDPLPLELQLVLARMTVAIGVQNNVEIGVQRKKVEDFEITYGDDRKDYFVEVVASNGGVLQKYSQCKVRFGRTLKEEARYYHNDRI